MDRRLAMLGDDSRARVALRAMADAAVEGFGDFELNSTFNASVDMTVQHARQLRDLLDPKDTLDWHRGAEEHAGQGVPEGELELKSDSSDFQLRHAQLRFSGAHFHCVHVH